MPEPVRSLGTHLHVRLVPLSTHPRKRPNLSSPSTYINDALSPDSSPHALVCRIACTARQACATSVTINDNPRAASCHDLTVSDIGHITAPPSTRLQRQCPSALSRPRRTVASIESCPARFAAASHVLRTRACITRHSSTASSGGTQSSLARLAFFDDIIITLSDTYLTDICPRCLGTITGR